MLHDAFLICGGDQISNRIVPSGEHLLQFEFPSTGPVLMIRRNICRRVPGKAVLTNVENAETFSAAPRLAVVARRDRSPIVPADAAPDGIASIDRSRVSEQLRANTGSNSIRANHRVVLFHGSVFKIDTYFVF